MSEPIFLSTIGVFFATIVAVFALRAYASVQQAKAKLLNDEGYRRLAADSAAAQAAAAAALADIQTRLTAVEKLLRDVE